VDCVFAIEDVNHRSYRSMSDAWSNTIESRNNVFLNLSDTPLPSDYPKPPAGWTILQGQQARAYWAEARADWIADAEGGGSSGGPTVPTEPVDPTPPQPPEPIDPPEPTEPTTPTPPTPPTGQEPGAPTFSGTNFVGGDSGERIVGNALNNNIDGDGGNDSIYGAGGADLLRGDEGSDRLWGGAGNDVFFFKRLSDSNQKYGADTVMDFAKGDRINVSVIDANETVSGDQAFRLVTGNLGTTPGQLKVAYEASSNTTVVTGSVDRDAEAEFVFKLAGKVDLSASDFML
jgi:Ca2+-binding RTX toxin-like protein